MPSTLFDQTLAPRRANRKPLGTVSISIVVHVAVLAAFAMLQLTTALGAPPVIAPLQAFAAAPDPPVAHVPPPPAVTRATSVPSVNPNAPPLEPPDEIAPELPGLPVATPGVPGSLFSGTGQTLTAPPLGTPAAHVDFEAVSRDPLRVGGAILAPTRVTYVAPLYPDIARVARVDGQVVLDATIDEWGVVTNITVRHSVPLLDRAAIEAVSKWRYAPTRLNGQPIAVVMTVTVTFTLR